MRRRRSDGDDGFLLLAIEDLFVFFTLDVTLDVILFVVFLFKFTKSLGASAHALRLHLVAVLVVVPAVVRPLAFVVSDVRRLHLLSAHAIFIITRAVVGMMPDRALSNQRSRRHVLGDGTGGVRSRGTYTFSKPLFTGPDDKAGTWHAQKTFRDVAGRQLLIGVLVHVPRTVGPVAGDDHVAARDPELAVPHRSPVCGIGFADVARVEPLEQQRAVDGHVEPMVGWHEIVDVDRRHVVGVRGPEVRQNPDEAHHSVRSGGGGTRTRQRGVDFGTKYATPYHIVLWHRDRRFQGSQHRGRPHVVRE